MLDVTRGSLFYARRQARVRRGQYPTRGIIATCARVVALWIERSRQRRILAAMDDHLLSDIGITRMEAEREARKPFWM